MKKDLTVHRADFPMLKRQVHNHPLIYLDSAATALKPQVVIDAIADFYANHYGTVHRAVYQLCAEATDRLNAARQEVAYFLNAADPSEIIFTSGTTASLNLIASSLGRYYLNLGDEVLISEIEHHSNIVPWQMACAAQGASLRIIPVDDSGTLILDDLDQLLTSRTKIVAVTHIAGSIGTLNPIAEISKACHRVGALLVVDGAQAAPHLSIDVRALGADFYAFSGHKAYGPTGIGVLYGRRELLNELPPYQGGGDMIEKVTFEETTYAPPPSRFEAGTPNIAGIIGLHAAINYIQAIGLTHIHAHEIALRNHAVTRLSEIDELSIIGNPPEKGAIISFTVNSLHPLDIATLLDLQGIAIRSGHHCSQPTLARFGLPATARISFGLYNTFDEVDLFIDALKKVILRLR